MNKLSRVCVFACLATLMGCNTMDNRAQYTLPYQGYSYDNTVYYHQGYSVDADYSGLGASFPRPVSVPESYHMNSYGSPTSHKDVDKNWVRTQNPQGYTIEIADDEKASQVARKLYQAPKNDRRAEIRYQRDGKAYYKGVYGSYKSYDEAQKALNNLPAEVKAGAGVKNWGSVQSTVND